MITLTVEKLHKGYNSSQIRMTADGCPQCGERLLDMFPDKLTHLSEIKTVLCSNTGCDYIREVFVPQWQKDVLIAKIVIDVLKLSK